VPTQDRSDRLIQGWWKAGIRLLGSSSNGRQTEVGMYGIINRFTAHPGKRDELIAAMTSDEGGLEGCRSFVVAHDATDPDVMWLTEIWDSKARWQASVERPGVKASIDVAVPLVKDWGTTVETEVVKVLPD